MQQNVHWQESERELKIKDERAELKATSKKDRRVEVLSDLIVKLLFYQSTTFILKGERERNAVVL
jgi:hypothetical protein